jgi:hypothetical protein
MKIDESASIASYYYARSAVTGLRRARRGERLCGVRVSCVNIRFSFINTVFTLYIL